MSAYRILLNNQRIATAAVADGESLYQVYPEKEHVPSKDAWVFWTLVEKAQGAKSFTLRNLDGSETTYFAEKYKLFHDGRCVSAGYRLAHMFVQRFPYKDHFSSQLALLAERAPLFGVQTVLQMKTKAPVSTPPPPPKERVPRTLTPNQVNRLQTFRKLAQARRALRDAEDAYHRSGQSPEALSNFDKAHHTYEMLYTLAWELPRK